MIIWWSQRLILTGKGLFSKIILQSGTALAPWAFVKDALTVTRRLAEKLNCLKNRVNDFPESAAKADISSQIHPILVQCLRQVRFLFTSTFSINPPSILSGFGKVEFIKPWLKVLINLADFVVFNLDYFYYWNQFNFKINFIRHLEMVYNFQCVN